MLAAALLLPSLLSGDAEPPANAVKLNEPRVNYRANEASATRSPWIDSNGWRILRTPSGTFTYQVKGETAALAAAEAFTYGTGATITTDTAGSDAFGRMLEFLKIIPSAVLSPVADFGVVDDGSNQTGELLNLLTKMNLLYKIEKSPSRDFRLNVHLALKDEAQTASALAHRIRSQIGDGERSLRIYGSEVVIGRLMGGAGQARVFLLNYAARPVLGLRVRVRGSYTKGELRVSGMTDQHPADWAQDTKATEFTIPELRVYAVVDLSL